MLSKDVKDYLAIACLAGFSEEQIKSELVELCQHEFDDEARQYYNEYGDTYDAWVESQRKAHELD